jgi:hypothetical protein
MKGGFFHAVILFRNNHILNQECKKIVLGKIRNQ